MIIWPDSNVKYTDWFRFNVYYNLLGVRWAGTPHEDLIKPGMGMLAFRYLPPRCNVKKSMFKLLVLIVPSLYRKDAFRMKAGLEWAGGIFEAPGMLLI